MKCDTGAIRDQVAATRDSPGRPGTVNVFQAATSHLRCAAAQIFVRLPGTNKSKSDKLTHRQGTLATSTLHKPMQG